MENEYAPRTLRRPPPPSIANAVDLTILKMRVDCWRDWSDRASAAEEAGRDPSAWKRLAGEKAEEIRLMLDEAERKGVPSLPEVPSLSAVPTRYKLREEIDALKAEVAAAEQKLEDMKTLRASATFMRLKAETSLRRWKVLALALGALAAIGWIF